MTSGEQRRRLFDMQMNSSPLSLENQNPTNDYTLRKMYEDKRRLNTEQVMRYKTIMESMTDKELDALNPDDMTLKRKMVIGRGSSQRLNQLIEMLNEFKNLERLMSETKVMDMSTLFSNEIGNLPFYAEKIPPRKLELMDWVKWALIYVGIFVFGFLLGMSLP